MPDLTVKDARTGEIVNFSARLAVHNENYTFRLADFGSILIHSDNSSYTWTIPPKSTINWPRGSLINIAKNGGSGTLTIAPGTGVSLYLSGTNTDGSMVLAASKRWNVTIFMAENNVWLISDGSTASGKITTFIQTTAPTAEVAGDLWIDSDDGNNIYRWNGSSWVDIQDTGIPQAIADAATAQATANTKILTFIQTTPPTAGETGDFWIDSDDNNLLYRWSGAAWVDARDDTIATAQTTANTAQTTANTKILTFRQATAPTAITVGDFWIDSDDDTIYRWSGAAWVKSGASGVDDGADVTANNAGDIVFRQATAPASPQTGWVWIDTDDTLIYRWSGSAWVQISALDALLLTNAPAEAGANVTANHAMGLLNPRFEAGDTGWTKGTGWSIVSDGQAADGSYAAKGAGATIGSLINDRYIPIGAGDRLLATALAKKTAGAGSARMLIYWYDVAKAVLSNTAGGNTSSATYVRIRASVVAPASAAFARVAIDVFSEDASTVVYVDQIEAALVPTDADINIAGTTGAGALATRDTVANSHIDNSAVGTLKVATAAVSKVDAAYTSGTITLTTSWQDAQTVSHAITGDGSPWPAEIKAACYFPCALATGSITAQMQLLRDTTVIYGPVDVAVITPADSDAAAAALILDSPAAGTYTYKMQVKYTTGGATGIAYCGNRALVVTGLKR